MKKSYGKRKFGKLAQTGVIITVVLILISLVAVGIYAVFLKKQVSSVTQEDAGSAVPLVAFQIREASLNNNILALQINRPSGKGNLSVLNFKLTNSSGSSYSWVNNTSLPKELETLSYSSDLTGKISNPTLIYVTPIFGNRAGIEVSKQIVGGAQVNSLDNIYPQFFNYSDNSESLIGSGTGLFNITVENTNGTVWLEINGANVSATNLIANVFNASYSFTRSGNYVYKWGSYGNGVSSLLNISSTRHYVVNSKTHHISWVYQEDANETASQSFYIYVNYTKPINSTSDSLWLVKHGEFSPYNISWVGGNALQCWNAYADKLVLRMYSAYFVNLGSTVLSEAQCFNGSNWISVGKLARQLAGAYGGNPASPNLALDGNWDTNIAWGSSWDYGWLTETAMNVPRWYEEAMWWNIDQYY